MRLRARSRSGACTVGFVLALSSVASAQYDNCQDTALSSFLYWTDLGAATIDGSSSCQPSPYPDVWWSYRPATSGIFFVEVCAATSPTPTNTLLSVHTGCLGTASNEVACNDDAPPPTPCGQPATSRILTPVTAGVLYFVRVSSADGSSGPVYLQAGGPAPTPPPNNVWQTAFAVVPGIVHGNNFHAGFPGMSGVGSVWYSYTPSTSGVAVAETCGLTAQNTILELRQGSTYLAYADDNCGFEQSRIQWNAVAGVEYQIGHGFWWGDEHTFPMRLTGPLAVQEDCATAQTIGDGVRWMSLENAGAEGASSCDASGAPDVFFRYVTQSAGVLTVSTLGSDDGQFPDAGEDTLVSLHSGCPATSANTIACNDTAPANALDGGWLADASVSLLVQAGQEIFIRVARVGPDQSGSNFPVRLEVSLAPADFTSCAGDGTAAACPCSNFGASGHGCANSQDASGALLAATGSPSVTNDTLALHGSHMPASGTAMYVQGTTAAQSGAGFAFGDGVRCVTGTIRRLGVRTSVGGASSFGHSDGVHVSTAGLIPPAGGSRVYQIWHRDAAAFCTSSTFNFSNGLSISWGP